MNKRQVKKVMGLLKEGIALQTVLMMIIELSKSPIEAAEIIQENFTLKVKEAL
jgi:hypothetical protein